MQVAEEQQSTVSLTRMVCRSIIDRGLGTLMLVNHGSPRTNALVGFIVGVAGGLISLGRAELRLPYLVGVLGLTPIERCR